MNADKKVIARQLKAYFFYKHTLPFTGERGQFGMDAEIRTHQALHEAKPSECPKGDRDNKSEVCFKNILFLQAETRRLCRRVPIISASTE